MFIKLQELLAQRAKIDNQMRAIRIQGVLASLAKIADKSRLHTTLENQLDGLLMRPLRDNEAIDELLEHMEAVLNIIEE